MPPPPHSGTPFTRFVVPEGAPCKAQVAAPACRRHPTLAHPSHVSWPHREYHFCCFETCYPALLLLATCCSSPRTSIPTALVPPTSIRVVCIHATAAPGARRPYFSSSCYSCSLWSRPCPPFLVRPCSCYPSTPATPCYPCYLFFSCPCTFYPRYPCSSSCCACPILPLLLLPLDQLLVASRDFHHPSPAWLFVESPTTHVHAVFCRTCVVDPGAADRVRGVLRGRGGEGVCPHVSLRTRS